MFKLPRLRKSKCSIASQWQALVVLALAVARKISGMETRALTKVAQQIEADGKAANAAKPFDQQLPPIAAILLQILRWVRGVICRLRAALAALKPARAFEPCSGGALKPRPHTYARLDPG